MSVDKTIFQPKPEGSLRQGVRLNGIFEIETLIAEGGMGEVYKGVAVASGDAVAIKLVRPELSRDPEVMALFKREAQILHDLLHDAIVRYYVFSLEPELQRYYIAMEFVDGVSLQKRLADGPLSPAEARILLKRIGGALEQAHSRGVIHRDISSDNIILPGGDVRKAKIVDFGIARAARAGEGTIIGAGFAGKYKYVSPEQLGLFGGEVTPKSDIYSFGLVIAEALRSQPLDMGGSQVEVVEKRRAVPDLSGIDVSLRPLLTAMLAPDPQDRPENMAEIAAWGDGATMLQSAPRAQAPPAEAPKRRGAGLAIAAAAALVVAAGGGAAVYLFRDALGLGGRSSTVAISTGSPTPAFTPPALGPKETSTPAVSPTSVATPTKAEPTAQGTTVTADVLLEQMPPKPATSFVTLAPATVGSPYRAELPEFSDPAGKGLVLHAAPAPPAGLAFKSLGGGRSEIAGEPTAAGQGEFEIVAVTEAGKKAHMKIALTVNPRPQASPSPQASPRPAPPPQPAQSVLDLEPATAGTAYSAGLPPFRSQEAVALRAGPGVPPGLTLNDLGNGLSQLAGEPRTPGKYAFDVVARTAGGAEGRMKARIEVAPPAAHAVETPVVVPSIPQAAETHVVATPSPQPTPTPVVAPSTPRPTAPPVVATPTIKPTTAPVVATPEPMPTPAASPTPSSSPVVAAVETPPPAASAAAFLRDYPAAPCFAARLRDDDPSGRTIATVGADPADFERFGAAFKQAVRAEPDLRGYVVLKNQCPAVDFLEAASSSAKVLPRIVLDSPLVGANRPLSGTILGLAGRPLLLLVIDDDGNAFRLRPLASTGGDSATFSANFTGDPSSIGKPQLLIAAVSDRPLGASENIDGAKSASLMPKLIAQGKETRAGAAFALFKFVQ